MHITRAKKEFIRRRYIAGELSIKQMATALHLQRKTIRFYLDECKIIEEQYPEKINDFNFFIGKEKIKKASPWYLNLMSALPEIVANEPGPVLICSELYRKYVKIFPGEYGSVQFYHLFKPWFNEHKNALSAAKLKAKFTPEELETLARWRKSNDRYRWQVAVALTTVYSYHSMSELADRLEVSKITLRRWRNIFNTQGLAGLDRNGDERPLKKEKIEEIEQKMDNLIHLVRQPPKTYGIDRASWFLADLVTVYEKVYGKSIALTMVSLYLKRRGVRFKRSREVIVSTDPDYLEKYEVIQKILENLGEKEKFFSIDEYGPCSVRPKGGRLLVPKGVSPVYEKVEKGKGWFICTCALELSTNQLTWFYSRKKDTDEMIGLIEVLSKQYHDQERLYISWDAASWHASKKLMDYLAALNAGQKPEIILAPLPSRSPNLNVIESVFSGMSKSVIRNSNYESLGECKAAIDRYFEKRNNYFLENPKKAGQKIWGKEKVKPVFHKANITKNL